MKKRMAMLRNFLMGDASANRMTGKTSTRDLSDDMRKRDNASIRPERLRDRRAPRATVRRGHAYRVVV